MQGTSTGFPGLQGMSFKLTGTSQRGLHLFWVGVVMVALVAGYLLGQARRPDDLSGVVSALQARLDVMSAQYRHELSGVTATRDALQSQLLVEQTTRATLETTLQGVQADLAGARERLAFYEQLLPPGPAGEITIRAFDLESRPGLLAYRVLLMRNGSQGSPVNALMEFVATGVQNGKTVKMTLVAAAAASPAVISPDGSGNNPLQLNFDQFQRAEGFLGVPPDFDVQSVTLNILEGTTVRATRNTSVAPVAGPVESTS